MEKKLTTPVLFLVFNRLDTTKQVFEVIRKAKPPRLYIASDGPRENKEGEAEKVKEVREYVLNNIDWDCKVQTLFRDKNLGCGKAVSSAITWFFENEEMGIILEDDCLPSLSFFWFCEELLNKYEDDERIWHIGGCNFQNSIKRGKASYYFSVINHVWGWASWANRWQKYDFKLSNINNTDFLKKTFENKKALKYWTKIFGMMKENKTGIWGYQWTFTMWFNNGLAILPNVNMISNLGFREDATHTIGESKMANMKTYELIITKHPSQIIQDKEADEYTFKKYLFAGSLLVRILRRIKGDIKRIIKLVIAK